MKPKYRIIHKAVIPIAGLGTRMGPICKAVPKAMFPLIDSRGRLRPIVHHICMEASASGIDRVALIVPGQSTDLLHRYFTAASQVSAAELPVNIDFIAQPAPRGLGDAVLLARDFVGGEPFLLLLGDHVWVAEDRTRPCGAQVVEAYADYPGAAMVGMQVVGPEGLPANGVAGGRLVKDDVYVCQELAEKPDLATARQQLATPNLGADRFLAHGGIYLFTPEIFDCLRELTTAYRPAGEELQLTAAQAILRRRHPQDYFLVRIAGQCLDTGTPAGYTAAMDAVLKAPCHA
jgi:UTP--glucose-1-phosphate uridylyltransferase